MQSVENSVSHCHFSQNIADELAISAVSNIEGVMWLVLTDLQTTWVDI